MGLGEGEVVAADVRRARLYVADAGNHRVQVLTKEGAYVRTLGVTGECGAGNHQFSEPSGVCVASTATLASGPGMGKYPSQAICSGAVYMQTQIRFVQVQT